MTKVLFLHGMESKPGGTKAKYLTKQGYEVLNPGLPKYSFEESVAIAQGVIDRELPDVIVGSSRGGAVAMCVEPGTAGVVLIAPAWTRFMQTANSKVSSSTMILHCVSDDIVPFSDSQQLFDTYGATLVKVGTCHRMSDESALEALAEAVAWTTKRKS
jgi:predicted alpha/beta hydrolase family esterase